MKILILNGPNLNRLGRREPGIYGSETMEQYLQRLQIDFPDHCIEYYQSNHEGALIDRLQAAEDEGVEGVVLNAGAYTHTSIALQDAIRSISVPVVEVHISNVHQREEFRHRSLLSPACQGVVCGFGMESYRLGLLGLLLKK